MFLAIIFVCLNAGECAFITAPLVSSQTLCESVLKDRYFLLHQRKDEFFILTGNCIEVKYSKGEI